MLATIAAGPYGEATVYIHITRGAAPRRHAFPDKMTPLELLFVQDFLDPYLEGWRRQLLDVATAHEQQATVTSETYQNAVATCKLSQAATASRRLRPKPHLAAVPRV